MRTFVILSEKPAYYLTEVDKNPNSIYCYHNPMGEQYIRSHIHQKGQFLYTEGGLVYVEMENRTYYLPARHYMWIPPNIRHAIYPSTPKVVMRNLYFPEALANSKFYKEEGIYPINNLLLELLLFTKDWMGNITKNQKEKYTIVKAFKILLEETVSQSLKLELPQARDKTLKDIVVYLSQNIHQEHLLPELASKFNMTDKSLYRLFKKDLGMSYIKYYTQLRIFKSLEYLMIPKYNISEIAQMVGYASMPTFSNTFVKIMGKRPSEYRNTNTIY